MTNLQKIHELLLKSDLALENQNGLLMLFARTRDADLEPAVKLLSEDPNWVKELNKNYKAKQEAINNKDSALWQKIIQEEEKSLEKL